MTQPKIVTFDRLVQNYILSSGRKLALLNPVYQKNLGFSYEKFTRDTGFITPYASRTNIDKKQ
ncbi:hypothetical protein [Microcoleus vaginatus]|uniref:hypothetical protein n=1 Tax=Microcoleus vaginatus TaxID=119532 RepID=UPI001F60FD19|nr:hypothetical protein D0A37_13170 [Microcoleus vaginatus HSN003]